MSRVNPYTALRDKCRRWALAVTNPDKRTMFFYPAEKINDARWKLDDLHQRVAAADQLGYDVKLAVEDRGLVVYYVKRPPPPPWNIQP